ncbi:MAG: ribosomal protein L7/L12 [Pirellulales bacterium]
MSSSHGPEGFENRVIALVAEGRTLEAIKLYREATGVGLKEAKDFVEALAATNRALPVQAQAVDERVLQLLTDQRKIEAIKVYRQATGVGLKEAKEAVEAIARLRGIESKSGCLTILLFAVTALVAAAI